MCPLCEQELLGGAELLQKSQELSERSSELQAL